MFAGPDFLVDAVQTAEPAMAGKPAALQQCLDVIHVQTLRLARSFAGKWRCCKSG